MWSNGLQAIKLKRGENYNNGEDQEQSMLMYVMIYENASDEKKIGSYLNGSVPAK